MDTREGRDGKGMEGKGSRILKEEQRAM